MMVIHDSAKKLKPTSSDIYYNGQYWNDYDLVREMINSKISGDKCKNWIWNFKENYCTSKRFENALFLNCGNGWVEREMFAANIFNKGFGVDCSESLLQEAMSKALELNMPVRYVVLDINTDDLPEENFDLIVNHAACHHIAYINKVINKLSKIITKDGYFVSFDYVGPHRNQYPYEQWNAIFQLNNKLPEQFKKNILMDYPHIYTMIHNDPSEAVHSEIIHETINRYFEYVEHEKLGGCLAYPLLTFNKKIEDASKQEREKWLPFILEEDKKYTDKTGLSMFDYFVCKKKANINLTDTEIDGLQEEENSRELVSYNNKGLYYELSLLQFIIFEYYDLNDLCKSKHLGVTNCKKFINFIVKCSTTIRKNLRDFFKY